MAKYDLTWDMIEFLDLQLVFPLFEFLAEHKVYDRKEVLEAKFALLHKTKMLDYLAEIYVQLYDEEIPEQYTAMRRKVMAEHDAKNVGMTDISCIIDDDRVQDLINGPESRDSSQLMDILIKDFQFHPSMLDRLYQHAKFSFDIGNYKPAGVDLNFYRALLQVPHHHPNYVHALWGNLACSILNQEWPKARDDLVKLKAYIDNNPFDNDLELLQQRAYFINWSLFVFFNQPNGCDDIVEMFLSNNAYLNPIQMLCPYVLRYLAGAVILNRRRRQCMRDLVRVIELEAHQYRDPITEFIECLYIRYDFDLAQSKLRECEEVVKKDFFLVNCLGEFIDSARMLTFEIYCRINRCVSVSSLADKLSMTEEDAEKWVVNLIGQSRLDAKLDAKLGHIIVGNRLNNVYEMVMEATKTLSFRAQSLEFQLEKFMNENEEFSPKQDSDANFFFNDNPGSWALRQNFFYPRYFYDDYVQATGRGLLY
ncbi:eukaryotic translation initiation factor 3 [Trichuris trichiura]|uniref:Eukaryotic translation initiation factor 3 subunit E n=1 Tax=Trichuris trichiura TaxID=36087 RepID=A0A077Z3L3_TRITR|nr:eukaryotic translation initiation factor 3 [Trichuris trichiura]